MTDLETLAAELEAAKQDLALFQRLTSAEQRVEQLTVEYDKAQAVNERAEANEAKAAHAARFDGLSDIRVETSQDPYNPSLMGATFTISWSAPAFDAWRGAHVKRHTRHSFAALPPKVFAYLVEENADRIPAAILALAPGDPVGAIDIYLSALRRGYFIGKVPA